MTLRNLWGHELFVRETPEAGGAPAVQGTGEAVPTATTQQPPPGAQPVADGGQPGPIPYSRFKEVNDAKNTLEERMQPFADLEDLGYPADELQRLAQWEQEYMQDPVGVWLRQAEQIDGFPEELKAAITAHAATGAQGNGSTDGPPAPTGASSEAGDEPPEWARPLIQDHQTRQEREQAEAISSFYDGLVSAWKDLDKEQSISTPDEAIHAHLAAASPNAGSAEELLRTARETWLAVRSATLGAEIRPPGRTGTVPQSVPGSVGSVSAPPVRPRTLQEAKKLALADPSITGTG